MWYVSKCTTCWSSTPNMHKHNQRIILPMDVIRRLESWIKAFLSATAYEDKHGETPQKYMIFPIPLKTWEQTRGFGIFLKECLGHVRQHMPKIGELGKISLKHENNKKKSTYEHWNAPITCENIVILIHVLFWEAFFQGDIFFRKRIPKETWKHLFGEVRKCFPRETWKHFPKESSL